VKGSSLVTRRQISDNHEPRLNGLQPTYIVLHYTGMASGAAAVDWLCNPESKVSCHYLIDVDGSVVQMVSEDRRAWHAGVSSWNGCVDINSASLGIEIQNGGHNVGLPLFPVLQMQSVARLCLDIMARYDMAPHDVLAHSDIAPGRKVDPGEAFDWEYLAKQGVGQVVQSPAVGDAGSIAEFQSLLAALGYRIDINGDFDNRSRIVVEALQRRYRRHKIDGQLDSETFDIARRLLKIQPDIVLV
jgi:N-acetylmuramoyl-L-alanine amidase